MAEKKEAKEASAVMRFRSSSPQSRGAGVFTWFLPGFGVVRVIFLAPPWIVSMF